MVKSNKEKRQLTKPLQEEEAMVGLHIHIPKTLRNQLKIKSIEDGLTMKNAIIHLIEGYVSRDD